MDAILNDVLAEQQRTLRTTMRAKFPFLKDEALDRVLSGASDFIREGIKQEAPAMEESQTRFDFFSLPAELRNNIYEDVITSARCVQQVTIHHGQTRRNGSSTFGYKPCPATPPLTRVSRQIRQETLPIFLGGDLEAYVDIDETRRSAHTRIADLKAWLKMIGPGSLPLIRSLTIYMPLPEEPCMWDPDCVCDTHDFFRPTSSKDLCIYLGLDKLGIKPDIVRGLFGSHMVAYDGDLNDLKGAQWQLASHDIDLFSLWWLPIPGEQHRDGDNGIWEEDATGEDGNERDEDEGNEDE